MIEMQREIFTAIPAKETRNGQIRVVNKSKIIAADPKLGVTTENSHFFEQYWDGEWLPINVVEDLQNFQ